MLQTWKDYHKYFKTHYQIYYSYKNSKHFEYSQTKCNICPKLNIVTELHGKVHVITTPIVKYIFILIWSLDQ